MALSRANPMKRWTRIACLLLSLLFLMGCAPQGEITEPVTAPDSSGAAVDIQPETAARTEAALAQIKTLGSSPDDNYRTWYEIFVYSFCDSDGDGIGDIPGVISRLDYLQELGITGIWLMPINPSQSYHKYDVADYYAIDPAYGTLADMDELLQQCEQRGIKVIMDLVLNHTGNNHAWFLSAVEYLRSLPAGMEPDLAECPYVGYYYFSREAAGGYHAVTGSDWYYEGQFSPDMPDLNLGNELVRQEIEAIMAFWLGRGVHGFRLDAVKEFYSGDTASNVEVLAWLQHTAFSYKEDAYLVGEAWEGASTLPDYYASGMTSFFNFPFGNSDGKIVATLRAAGNGNMVQKHVPALVRLQDEFLARNPDYIDAPFLSNHDVGRIAGFMNRDPVKTKLAGAMNILMSGSCFIYYGEEIGMIGSGNDPSKRAPMYWNTARDNGTTNPPLECTLPEEYPNGSLEEQLTDDDSVYNYYRQAIAIRNSMPVIARGTVSVEEALNVGCISAQRKTWGHESCIIVMNIAPDSASVDLSEYDGWTVAATLSADGTSVERNGADLRMGAFGVAILTQQ